MWAGYQQLNFHNKSEVISHEYVNCGWSSLRQIKTKNENAEMSCQVYTPVDSLKKEYVGSTEHCLLTIICKFYFFCFVLGVLALLSSACFLIRAHQFSLLSDTDVDRLICV